MATLLSPGPHSQETGQTGSAGGGGQGSGSGIDHNAVGELVGLLAVNSCEAPAYIGSSSGLSLAANLGEMVQATVWNQVLASSYNQPSSIPSGAKENGTAPSNPRINGLPPQPTPSNRVSGLDQPRTLRMDELLAKSTEPPNDEMGGRMLHAYLTRLHVRYPFIDRIELWCLHEDRWRLARTKREELTRSEKFGIFKLYLIYAISATIIQLSEKYDYVPPEVCYYVPRFVLLKACTERLSALLYHGPSASASYV